MQYNSESGRSLLELLMVLIIMGIITVASVWGYSQLSAKAEAGTVGQAVLKHVIEYRHKALTKTGSQSFTVSDIVGPHGVKFDITNDSVNHLIVVTVRSDNEDLVEALLNDKMLKKQGKIIESTTNRIQVSFSQFKQ